MTWYRTKPLPEPIKTQFIHHNEVIMGAMASQTPASRLFTQPFIQVQIKENTKAPRHRWSVNSPHKGPVTRKMFPLKQSHYESLLCRQWQKSWFWHFSVFSIWDISAEWFATGKRYSIKIAAHKFSDFSEYFLSSTHWGRDKTAAISATTDSSAFSWTKTFESSLKVHWNTFVSV